MKRLTEHHFKKQDGFYMTCSEHCSKEDFSCEDCGELDKLVDRLGTIEDILGDDYDLGRLRELVEAYREDRYIVLKEPRQAGVHRLSELAEADREGRCAIVIRCCACKHYKDIDGMHWCNFWHMCCPNDSEFYCKAAK